MTLDISKSHASAIVVKKVKPRLHRDSTSHIVMMVLKSFGINNFVTKDQIAFVTPRANTYRLYDILKKPINHGYILKSGDAYAITPLGSHVLYNLAEHSPGPEAGWQKEGTEGLLTIEELEQIESNS